MKDQGNVLERWLPHHEMEARTRETCTYYLEKHSCAC
jgi:hypothetical protein